MHRLAPQRTLATTAPSRYRRLRHPILCHKQSSSLSNRRSFSPFGLGGSTSRSSVVPFPHPEPANEQSETVNEPNLFGHQDSPISSRRLVSPFSTTVLSSPTADSSRTKHPQVGVMGQRRHQCRREEIIVVPAPDDDASSSSCPASELSTGALAANKAQSPERQPQKEKKTVAFGTVQIREYVMCLGDNPSCECGPPLSLSWEYAPHPRGDRDVMEYEKRRKAPKLRGTQLKLSPEARRAILRRLGESEERMERVAEELRKIQTEREESSAEDDSPKLVFGHPHHKLGELCSVSLTVMRKILYV